MYGPLLLIAFIIHAILFMIKTFISSVSMIGTSIVTKIQTSKYFDQSDADNKEDDKKFYSY